MYNKSDFILLLQEGWKRLKERSPKFFRVIGWVSIAMSGVGFIPDFLEFIGVTLPAAWMAVVGKLMIGAGIWGKITSSFPVSVPAPEVMPFTEKKNMQQEQKEVLKQASSVTF